MAHSITRRLFLRPKSSLRNAFVVETVFVKRSRGRQVGEWVGLTLILAILGLKGLFVDGGGGGTVKKTCAPAYSSSPARAAHETKSGKLATTTTTTTRNDEILPHLSLSLPLPRDATGPRRTTTERRRTNDRARIPSVRTRAMVQALARSLGRTKERFTVG